MDWNVVLLPQLVIPPFLGAFRQFLRRHLVHGCRMPSFWRLARVVHRRKDGVEADIRQQAREELEDGGLVINDRDAAIGSLRHIRD